MHARMSRFFTAVILLCGVLAYAGSLGGCFIFDDNPHIARSNTIDNLLEYVSGSSRPLTALTFHLNYLISGYEPVDYHAVNVVIHLLAALLVYGIVRRALLAGEIVPAWGEGQSSLAALAGALLWGVHPLQTAGVTYIVQRAESLMGLFYLLTLYCTIRSTSTARRRGAWTAGAIVACFLGMAAKPIMATCPIMVLIFDRTFLAASCKAAVRARKALYCGLLASWVLLLFLVLAPNESTGSAGFSIATVSPLRYLATQPGVVCHYMTLMLFPRHLALDYAWPPAAEVGHVLGPALLIVGLVALAVVGTWRRHRAGFCMLWFFVVLAPSSSFIPVLDYAFEHRVYLPTAGMAALVAGAYVHGASFLSRSTRARRLIPGVAAVVLAAVVVALMARTIDRNRDYVSLLQITKSNARVRPHNFRARLMVIDVLLEDLKCAEAEQVARKLVMDIEHARAEGGRLYTTSASDPDYFRPHAVLRVGQALLFMGRQTEAIPLLENAIALDPDLDSAYHDLAVALAATGRFEDAQRAIDKALALSPDSAVSLMFSGILAIRKGNFLEARDLLERSAALNERSTIGRLELAWLLATAPDPEVRNGLRAVELASEVCQRTHGKSPRALDVLAAAYAESARFDEACETARRAQALARTADGTNEDVATGVRLSTVVSDVESIEMRVQCYTDGRPWRQGTTNNAVEGQDAHSLSRERETGK